MKNSLYSRPALLLAAFVVIAAAAALLAGVPFDVVMGAGVMLAPAPAAIVAPAARRPTVQWGRKVEPARTFQNVGANQTAYSNIPRYPRTLLGINLEKTGTTFTDAQLTRIEMFLGETSIWGPLSAADLRMIARYISGKKESGSEPDADPFWLPLDFTFNNVKEIGGEQIGGLDLTTLPRGALRLEADIAGATAPVLKGELLWSPPQGGGDLGGLMRKLVKRTYPAQTAGDFFPDIDTRGAIVARQFFKGIVFNDAVVTAFTAANAGVANTGNGAASATVLGLTPAGRYKAVVIEPAANAGRVAVFKPNGELEGTVTVGGGATTMPSGLVVTIADGGTDFVAGDGFFFDVLPLNTDGNINLVEVKKNEDVWFFKRDRAARYAQQRAGRVTQAGLFVADYLMDNHADSVVDTSNALSLDYRLNLTLADTISVIHELLAVPSYRAR